MLASPDVGFIVPTNATTNNGQNACSNANPSPVAAMRTEAASSSRRRECRCATQPIHSVSNAVPIKVLATIEPMANGLKPSSTR